MTVQEYIASIRRPLQDTKSTRFSDGAILDAINEALLNIARDTLYFKTTIQFKIYPHIKEYTLDNRIIKVVQSQYYGCVIPIYSTHDRCDTESENTLSYLYISKHNTRGIAVYPTLTAPTTEYTSVDAGIGLSVDNYEIVPAPDGGGVPLYIEEDEDQIVGINALTESFGTAYLQAIVYPDEVNFASDMAAFEELAELIKFFVVYTLLGDSNIGSSTSRATRMEKKYIELAKELKAMQAVAYADTTRTFTYRAPFTRNKARRNDDF